MRCTSAGATLSVTVTGVADKPTVNVSPAQGNEDTAISLNIGTTLADGFLKKGHAVVRGTRQGAHHQILIGDKPAVQASILAQVHQGSYPSALWA